MLQEIKDYAKCAIKNKGVLEGYLGIGASLLMPHIGDKMDMDLRCLNLITFGISSSLLVMTKCGAYTFKTYRKTKKHIKRTKTIKSRFKHKIPRDYCMEVGLKLAAKEKGLEHLI
jgi:hypothetical protein